MNRFLKKKSRKKINMLDTFLVVVIIALVVGFVLRFLYNDYGPFGKYKTHIEEYKITFSVSDTNLIDKENFKKDAVFHLTVNNAYFGFICEDAYYVPQYVYEKSDDGEMIKKETEENTVIITCKVNGCYKKDGFMLNGNTYIAPGSLMRIRSENFKGTIQILNIEKAE